MVDAVQAQTHKNVPYQEPFMHGEFQHPSSNENIPTNPV